MHVSTAGSARGNQACCNTGWVLEWLGRRQFVIYNSSQVVAHAVAEGQIYLQN